MEYGDIVDLVGKEVRHILDKRLDEKDCPECKKWCTMVRVLVENEDIETNWRCLNCLGLFTETLKEVE